MNIIQKTGILILSLVAASCSTKKDAFLNRNFHAVATKYNVLYNGQVAFQEGVRELNSKYEDDFWELLPIEPIKFEENSSKGSSLETKLGWKSFSNKDTDNQNLSSFERAEEKAVKAIQKHSMRFYGKRKIDKLTMPICCWGSRGIIQNDLFPLLKHSIILSPIIQRQT